MNYLAHAYLSFGEPALVAGNMMADFVHGKEALRFGEDVQAGIRLHRAIDAFTDSHPDTRRASGYLREACGRYAGVFIDIVYDHFLALDDHYFPAGTLAAFSRETYRMLEAYRPAFPVRFARVFSYMRHDDWLTGYRNTENIARAFSGIYRRARYLEESDAAFRAMLVHYEALGGCYRRFMPQLVNFARHYLEPPVDKSFARKDR